MNLENAVKASRKDTFDSSDQLTLGELILKFEPILEKQKERKEEAVVVYDFGYLFPTDIGSWRGSYSELALNYVASAGNESQKTVTEFIEMLKETVGKTLTGYKGGDFVMTKNTPVWVSNYGEACHTAIIDVVDNGYEVILITGLREY